MIERRGHARASFFVTIQRNSSIHYQGERFSRNPVVEGLSTMEYHVSPEAVPLEQVHVERADQQIKGHNSPLEINYSYINSTRSPIAVMFRSGISFEVPVLYSSTVGHFIVRASITIGPQVKPDIHGILHDVNDKSPNDLKLLKEAVAAAYAQGIHGRNTFHLDYKLTLEDITSKGGNVYLSELDIVLSVTQDRAPAHHPYSDRATRYQLIEADNNINSVDAFGYSVRIVDKSDCFGSRFVNINKQIFKVPVTKDGALKDGVYVCCSGPLSGNYDRPAPVCYHYSFEEAEEKAGLYQTFNEAKTLGDEFATRKRELDQQAYDLKQKENEMQREKLERNQQYEREKHEFESERLELEQALKERNAELQERTAEVKAFREQLEHERKIDELKQKEHYERRSYERKDTHEWLKFVPALITCASAIFIAVQKAQNGKT